MANLDLDSQTQKQFLAATLKRAQRFYENGKELKVASQADQRTVRHYVEQFDFTQGLPPEEAIRAVADGLEQFAVHTPHPRYFGLYNPRANFASIMADIMTAFYNPQIAAWSHAPFAAEVEAHLIREFGTRFGYPSHKSDGVFAGGGAEANLTALLCALHHHFPAIGESGIMDLPRRPVLYCSVEAHHSIVKAAKSIGLGASAVKDIPADDQQRMQPAKLRQRIQTDVDAGLQPFMVTGTAGTTGSGAIDPLPEIAAICRENRLWFHVDAAYGGAVALHKQYRQWIGGIELSDSITFDVHKWMSVPMAASMFLTSHPDILQKTFAISTDYMPKDAEDQPIVDPYVHSIQWSRRFIGLKLYLSLLIYGWEGYQDAITQQVAIGNYLRKKLVDSGWQVKNNSRLPVICFDHPTLQNDQKVRGLCDIIVKEGSVWISTYPINGRLTLRACITNYATTEADVDLLVETLERMRRGETTTDEWGDRGTGGKR